MKPLSSINRTIQLLYVVTKTEPDSSYLDNRKVSALIKSIQLLPKGSARPQLVSIDECRNIICFLLCLIDTPKKLDSLLALKPCTQYLINQALNNLKLVSDDDKNAITGIIAIFYDLVKFTSKPEDLELYNKKPKIDSSILARFHYDGYSSSLLTDGTYPLYSAYGYLLHKLVRFNSLQKLGEITIEAYIRSARYFFMYMPPDIKSNNYHPASIPYEYLDAFIAEYNCATTTSYLPLSTNAKNYKNSFLRLLNRWEGTPSSRLGHIPEDELYPLDGDLEILDKEEFDYRNAGVTLDDLDPLGQNEPFPDVDLGYIKKNSKLDVVDKKPKLARKWSDLVNLQSFHYPWDVKHLNLFHYAILYKAIAEVYEFGNSSKLTIIAIYLTMLIHTGIPFKKLLKLTVSGNDDKTDDLMLRNIHGKYYVISPSFIVRRDSFQSKHCYEPSPSTYIPVPDEIIQMFDNLPTSGRVFIFKNDAGSLTELSTVHINSFLNKYVKKERTHRRFNLQISLSKITSSFLTLYSSRCGLDQLICTHICGHDYYRLYSAQAHYVHVPHALLEEQYLNAFCLANTMIFKNYFDCLKLSFFAPFESKPPFFYAMQKIKPSKRQGDKLLKGYGSSIIVKDAYHANVMRSLKSKIKKESNPIDRHNLYTCYTYLALQFCTGMRPRNYPELTWENFNEILNTITISDKESARLHEIRTAPLANNVARLLSNMRVGYDKLRSFIALHHYPSILSKKHNDIFFFINGKGRHVDFDLDNLEILIRSVVDDYDLPANMPRHYLRNYLYHAGISNDIADAIFGHQHGGKEVLNVISSAIPTSISRLALPSIERMLRQLGVEELKYV